MTAIEHELRALIESVVREVLAESKPAPLNERITVAEFARRRSISPSTVRAAIREKRLAITRIGRLVRIAATAEIAPASRNSQRDRARLRLLGNGTVR